MEENSRRGQRGSISKDRKDFVKATFACISSIGSCFILMMRSVGTVNNLFIHIVHLFII